MMEPTNDILTSNLERLQAGEALRRQLETIKPQNITWDIAADGNPTLSIKGRQIYAPDGAVLQVAQEINGFLAKQNPDLIVFFGLGLGLHAQILRLKTEAPIIVFEPDLEVLASVLPSIPLDVEGITLVTNPGHLVEVAGKTLDQVHNKMAVGAINAYRDLYPEAFEQFCDSLRQALKNIDINQQTRAQFSQEWIAHLEANLPLLIRSGRLTTLADTFQGKTGILVGAGPSLDSNIAALKQAKNHALICAVHTAVMPLTRAGIIPDIVVIVESQHLESYFEDVPDLDQMVLAPAAHTHPTHLNLGFAGILTLATEGHPATDWLQEAYGFKVLKAGGSVACTAFSILHELGCDPIIMVGMDAAFTHGRTHSLGAEVGCCRVEHDPETQTMTFAYFDEKRGEGQWDSQFVQAWGGKDQVLTRPVFSSFRHWFEGASQTWAAGRTLINATEGGARFHGFQEMRLSEALGEYGQQEVPAAVWLGEKLAHNEELDPRPLGKVIQSEIDLIGEAADWAKKSEKEASRALQMLRSGRLGTLQPVLDKLAVYEIRLRELTLQTRLLNTLVGHRAMALSMGKAKGDDKVSQTIHSVENSRQISRLVAKGAKELEGIFGGLVRNLLEGEG